MSITEAFRIIEQKVGVVHGVVHSIAFADKDELRGEYVDTSREGYLMAQSISAYSLVAIAKAAKRLMTERVSVRSSFSPVCPII